MSEAERPTPGPSPSRHPGTSPGVTPLRAVSTVAGALIAASLPVFLLSALAPSVQLDLGFSEAGLGIAVAAFFLAAAASSVPGGRFADRFGAPIALRTGLGIAAAGGLIVALIADSRWSLAAAMFLGGTALGFVDTGGARAISASVPGHRQGLAFGSKEASIPAASFLAGASVPLLGAQLGWRPAFGLGAGFAVLVGASVSQRLETPKATSTGSATVGDDLTSAPLVPVTNDHSPDGRSTTGAAPLVLLSITAGLGGGAAAATTAFLVASSVTGGLAAGAAGILLAVASAVAIGARLAVGAAADRRAAAAVPLVATMLAVGGTGVAGLATSATELLPLPVAATVLVISAVVAIGAGWGWTGLVFLAAVRLDPERPAKAAGIVLVGLGIGGAIAPAIFGAVAARAGYASAWSLASAAMFTAMVTAVTAHQAARTDP
jgi:predicted MFS family arabinose efflux permease